MSTRDDLIRDIQDLALQTAGPNLMNRIPQKIVSHLYDCVFAYLLAKLKAHGEVTLPGIGKLRLVYRNPRKGRHPVTGAIVPIPAKVVVKLFSLRSLSAELAGKTKATEAA